MNAKIFCTISTLCLLSTPLLFAQVVYSNLKFVNTNNTQPTQILSLDVSGGTANDTYFLNYVAASGNYRYKLCSTLNNTKCTGVIPIRKLPSLGEMPTTDYFYLETLSGSRSQSYSAANLVAPINEVIPWSKYSCGLQYPYQAPPKPKCLFNDQVAQSSNLGTSSGCVPKEDSIISSSVAGFYFPNKFGDNNYGLSCTAIPIDDGSWVITAGHCVGNNGGFFADASKIFILPGRPKLPIEASNDQIQKQGIKVAAEYILKSEGDNSKCDNQCQVYADFALLKLKDYKFPNPVSLIDKSTVMEKGDQIWIAGYGMHNYGNQGEIRNGQLHYRNEYYWGTSSQYGVLYSVGTLPDQRGYSWKFDGNGDSGGPLFLFKHNKLYLISTLTGGTNFDQSGIQCKMGEDRIPGTIVENLSIQYWADTINSIIKGIADPNSYSVNNK